jgi:hypothetical protein
VLIELFPGIALRFKAGFYTCPILLLLLSLQSFSQTGISTPVHENNADRQALLKKHESRYLASLATTPKEYKKDFNEIYALRWNNIKDKFEKGEVYTSQPAQQYLDNVVNEIRTSNRSLKEQPFSCYFSKSGIPNASSLGEGVILINMGLFSRLQNESQLAFVLCHEISHFYLQHSESAINTYINRINSKAYQNELREIKSTTYGKRERLDQLTRRYSFDTHRHTRQNEDQADSMALELLRNTTFDITQSLTTLALLNTIDNDSLDVESSLVKNFDAAAYPFQKKWLRKETGLLSGHALLQAETWADSLKTHPDCSNRIAKLKPFVKITNALQPIKAIDTNLFVQLRENFRYESIEFEFNQGNYSRCLFYCFLLSEQNNPAKQNAGSTKNNSDHYLITMIGKNLNGIYNAFKEHKLSKVTDLPSPEYSQNYNSLCQFIQNLYAENVALINYHFLLKHKEQLSNSKDFAATFEITAKNAEK